MNCIRKFLLLKLLLALFCAPLHVGAAENAAPVWERYDETADLQELAQHENQSMHFKLLNSKVLDKNALWSPFLNELSSFAASRYESLKSLILEKDIASIQRAVANGELTYAELTTFYIYRIREIETDDSRFINAVIALNPRAIERAHSLDAQREQGRVVAEGSMFGIPVLLKDNIGFDGLPTTAGSLALAENRTANAFIADRLIENGAVILGKANLSEWAYFFCMSCPSGYSAMGGQTLNPYGRKSFGTGGSSSGSAAAMAANLAAVAVGSETSGSILSPASANSSVGLKPTTGSLSRTGIVPISATLDTAGPITRSVADAVTLFNAMAGFDGADSAMPLISEDFTLIYREVSLSGKRLGILDSFEDDPFYQQAISLFTNNGADAVPVSLNAPRSPRFSELLGGEMVRDLAAYLEYFASSNVSLSNIADLQKFNAEDSDLRAPYGQGLVDMMAELELSAEELEALRAELQTAARDQLQQIFAAGELNVLLSINNRNAGLAALANYPALTIPMGYQEDGRPIGLTLIAPSFQEQELIDVGSAFEQLSRARVLPEDFR
ncbi:MAG: amidase [SAR86 cluster bacterium]|uniref:Amidase n=1 Tax=SAR86 cluster bacterium TaxID=2030880 RepID=A0A2A4XA76_9GAMM|nr:MAG: amidase [SAR86 cluster bacterium]